jgi:protein-S-isoprenylcysteine O-methyltransferase Ste14
MLQAIQNNKKLSVLGIVVALSVVIMTNPSLITFLPDSWEPVVQGVAGLINMVAAYLGFKTNPNSLEIGNKDSEPPKS